jgi:hypothetical protein
MAPISETLPSFIKIKLMRRVGSPELYLKE